MRVGLKMRLRMGMRKELRLMEGLWESGGGWVS